MDDVAVWSRPLTDTEVAAIAADAVPINVKSATVTTGALVRNVAPTTNNDGPSAIYGTNEDTVTTVGTVHNFDTAGTVYTLQNDLSGPAPVVTAGGPSGSFLRLISNQTARMARTSPP